MIRLALALLTLVTFISGARGDIILDISDAGAGKTRFTFSGSTLAAANGNFANESYVIPGLFAASGNFNETDGALESNSAVFQNLTTGLSQPFDSVQIRNNPSDQLILDLAATLNTTSGDTLTASGSFVADVDFARFNVNSFTVNDGDTGTWRVNVAAVPEPSCFALLGIASLLLVRRKRC